MSSRGKRSAMKYKVIKITRCSNHLSCPTPIGENLYEPDEINIAFRHMEYYHKRPCGGCKAEVQEIK